jgi:capsular exopolysaccharide synthesis family protein
MGRVFEALRRAAAHDDAQPDEAGAPPAPRAEQAGAAGDEHRGQNGANGGGNAAVEALFGATSAYFNAPEAAHSSATTEHTIHAPAGSALPGGPAARVAGATVGAAGSTRDATFASVEVVAARVEPHLVAITEPRTPHAEQYRSLRTRVLHANERRRMQAVVVTSAGVSEGKTITALNLAWLMAQTDGVRALLVDGDLRQPCAADYLGLDAPIGLSEVLAHQATLADTILRVEPAGLYLLPGGTPRDDVAEILSGPKFNSLLAELRRMFDFVIIDAPPLGIFTDATVLINRADGALVVVRANKTRYGTLDRVLEPLARERLLGIVLNGAEGPADAHSYYYQRRYYRRDAAAEGAEPPASEEA